MTEAFASEQQQGAKASTGFRAHLRVREGPDQGTFVACTQVQH